MEARSRVVVAVALGLAAIVGGAVVAAWVARTAAPPSPPPARVVRDPRVEALLERVDALEHRLQESLSMPRRVSTDDGRKEAGAAARVEPVETRLAATAPAAAPQQPSAEETEVLAARNRESLRHLQAGMSLADIEAMVGPAGSVQVEKIGSAPTCTTCTIVRYRTDAAKGDAGTTPLVLVGGQLDRWGPGAWPEGKR